MNCSPDYLSLADLSLRSFASPEGTYKCWPRTRPTLEPWHTLLTPYAPVFPDLPPSPTDTCTSFASSSAGTPPPRTTHVVCNAPLVAPIPLPYHSPTFLQFELPDLDEDLSYPPYTTRRAGCHEAQAHRRPRGRRGPATETPSQRTRAHGARPPHPQQHHPRTALQAPSMSLLPVACYPTRYAPTPRLLPLLFPNPDVSASMYI
ncbi:hypothetical protein DFH09DRAFT_1299754 [Mycena vulgaris]|nr:hypothetical protein DFH09DRAFT_1299754 [Mycena vulgaris]